MLPMLRAVAADAPATCDITPAPAAAKLTVIWAPSVVRILSDSPSLTTATPAAVLEAALPGASDPPDVLALAAVLTTLPELLTTLRVFVLKRRFRAAFAKTLVPVALVTVAAVSPAAAPPLEADVLLLDPETPLLELAPPPVLLELPLARDPARLAPAALLPNCSRLIVPSLGP
jgi:hypothetical protein